MAKIEQVKNKKHEVIHPISSIPAVEGLEAALANKQDTLVSGENIKKINGESILGNGNIIISGSGGTITIDSELSETSENPVQNKVVTEAINNKQETLHDGINIKTVNGEPILGSGNLFIQEGDPSAVKFAPQELTAEQQAQARRNINAASLGDLNEVLFVTATVLPEPSAETMGYIFLIGPDEFNNYDRYFSQEEEGVYSWVPLGSTQIDLFTYTEKTETNLLAARLDTLAMTRYYGIFASADLLPQEVTARGYAYVGAQEPLIIYEFDGTNWINTDVGVTGIQGQPGVGFRTIETPVDSDGTVTITLTNGDTVVLNLNHDHLSYPKYHLCENEQEYQDMEVKDETTLYLIPEDA